MSISTMVEMHELSAEKAGKGEFTIEFKIRLGAQEQLLESPRQER